MNKNDSLKAFEDVVGLAKLLATSPQLFHTESKIKDLLTTRPQAFNKWSEVALNYPTIFKVNQIKPEGVFGRNSLSIGLLDRFYKLGAENSYPLSNEEMIEFIDGLAIQLGLLETAKLSNKENSSNTIEDISEQGRTWLAKISEGDFEEVINELERFFEEHKQIPSHYLLNYYALKSRYKILKKKEDQLTHIEINSDYLEFEKNVDIYRNRVLWAFSYFIEKITT